MKYILLILTLTHIGVAHAKRSIRHREKVVLERLVITKYNKDLIEVSARVDKINKTSYAINCNFTILKDLPPITDEIKVYADYNNEYRLVPISFSRSLCDIYKIETKWVWDEIMKNAHIPTGCPIKKGSYYIKDFIPNTSKMPFISPWSKIKSVFNHYVTKTKETFVIMEVYARIDKTGEYFKD